MNGSVGKTWEKKPGIISQGGPQLKYLCSLLGSSRLPFSLCPRQAWETQMAIILNDLTFFQQDYQGMLWGGRNVISKSSNFSSTILKNINISLEYNFIHKTF